jgi:hypothetical protein
MRPYSLGVPKSWVTGFFPLFAQNKGGAGGKRKRFTAVSFELINEFNDGELFHRPVRCNNVYGK